MTSNGQTVVVVEDDEETLNVLARALASAGYDVLWARNGPDTIKLLTRYDGPVALVVADVVLPEMSGPELVRELNERHPGIPALYVSAYDEETVRARGVDPNADGFLPKPCEPRDLVEAVRRRIGSGG